MRSNLLFSISAKLLPVFLAAFIFGITMSSLCLAENWPGWRGPRGDGSSRAVSLPVEWDAESGKNIAWKVTLPGSGHASPIVWEDHIFITACLTDQERRVLICLNRQSGQIIWQQTVLQAPLESIHALNSHASGTPATDGELVYVAFLEADGRMVPAPNVGTLRNITAGKILVAAYDFHGRQKWLVRTGDFISAHGFCSCPVIYEDLVIINGDHDGDSYIVALDKKTGVERWRIDRPYGIRSYVTPLIRQIDGRTQMVLSGSKHIASLNPRNGSTYWTIEGPTEQFVASMVYDGDLLFMACGYPDHFVMGIRPDGKGDVTDSHVVWETTSARCYVPSPVVVGSYLMVADDRGTANCFDARTGKRHWIARLGKGFSASLIHGQGLVYFTDQDGQTTVVRPDREVQIVAKNHLLERVSASPAVSEGRLYIRGENSLFCIQSSGNENVGNQFGP